MTKQSIPVLTDTSLPTEETYLTLINRYIQLIQTARPHVKPIKYENGSLALAHILWMLNKMLEPNYRPLTSTLAWISWCQASLYYHDLINIKHEKDITREIAKQLKQEALGD